MSPAPVPEVLVPVLPVEGTPAARVFPKLLGLESKHVLYTFPTPNPTPEEDPTPDVPTLKELLLKVCQDLLRLSVTQQP